MISKARYWMGIGKPKNQHSLDNLKYLYGILNKNQIVTENNKDLLIETLRSISEILIWGDQNDSSVFDFFLEKQMITFFLHYMKQKYGRFICVQLLQTLNILFENIRNETSLYFLLSNNHINNIILHKFDFSDEEVMAYYISFLKTLSLKLNSHSIHFFFNERASEFPLYVEAIKFFDHPESMVRIAVRTLTLNVYRVPVQSMQKFIKEKTAVFYFSNMVWLIRNHVLDLDICVKNTIDHTKKCRLIDLIDEHIDHLNYLQDIYMLNNQALSNCLSEQLVRRLLIPVYLSSLLKKDKFTIKDRKPYIQPTVAMFLLSHLFSIITYAPLLNDICELLFLVSDEKVIDDLCFRKVRSNTETDYLSEPKPLINCLASSQRASPKRRSSFNSSYSSRSRSKSVGAQLASSLLNDDSEDKSNTFRETIATNDQTTVKDEEGINEYDDNEDTVNDKEEETRKLKSPDDQEKVDSDDDDPDQAEVKESSKIPSLPMPFNRNTDDANDDAYEETIISASLNEKLDFSDFKAKIAPDNDVAFSNVNDENLFSLPSPITTSSLTTENITDDEKYRQSFLASSANNANLTPKGIIFESFLQYLNAQQHYSELDSLLGLSFLFTLINNTGVPSRFSELLKVRLVKNGSNDEVEACYNEPVIGKLIGIISKSVEPDFKVRLTTLELNIRIVKSLTLLNKKSYINDFHLACIEQAKEQSSFILRRQFKSEEMFLDMFEHEYHNFNESPCSFESHLRDWSILLAPTSTPLTGIEFSRRFPCGDTEKLKHSIRLFFLLRDLCLCLTNEHETQLPLTKQEHLVKENDALDLNSSDLIACTVNLKDKKERRFLVIDPIQFILVEPEVKRIGWGIVKFSDLIQDVEVTPDKEDSRSLNISIKKTPANNLSGKPQIILNSVFTFDDHIRCMAAKQHLVRARDRARRMKLEKIAQLLDISSNNNTSTNTNKNLLASTTSSSDILSYNLVAGRASMIGQWSQKSSNLLDKSTSPMIKNTAMPLFYTQQAQSHQAYHQLPGLSASSYSINPSNSISNLNKFLHSNSSINLNENKFQTNKNDAEVLENLVKQSNESNPSDNDKLVEANILENNTLAKTLLANTSQNLSLVDLNDKDHAMIASKIQLLPPVNDSSFNQLNTSNNNTNTPTTSPTRFSNKPLEELVFEDI